MVLLPRALSLQGDHKEELSEEPVLVDQTELPPLQPAGQYLEINRPDGVEVGQPARGTSPLGTYEAKKPSLTDEAALKVQANEKPVEGLAGERMQERTKQEQEGLGKREPALPAYEIVPEGEGIGSRRATNNGEEAVAAGQPMPTEVVPGDMSEVCPLLLSSHLGRSFQNSSL